MELNNRQQQILARLKQHGEIQIDNLAREFSITTQTVRRDVNQLCEQGLARRVHGGISLPATLANATYGVRSALEHPVKNAIAKAAANNIPDGSTIMLGIGTTISQLARHLRAKSSLRVVTNNIQAAKNLEGCSSIQVYLSGGRFRHDHQDLVGTAALDCFNQFEADISIVGCSSVNEQLFVMEHETCEADISQCLLKNARQKWLLADASKWSRFASVKVVPLEVFDEIYTNKSTLPDSLPAHLNHISADA